MADPKPPIDEPAGIAVCGLDCGPCTIRRLPFDAEAAEEVVTWFKKQGWLKEDEGVAEALERSMYCRGCHGDRTLHWGSDCWILLCCVDQKGLRHCSECDVFPCERLEEWSQQNASYRGAMQRLLEMHAAGTDP